MCGLWPKSEKKERSKFHIINQFHSYSCIQKSAGYVHSDVYATNKQIKNPTLLHCYKEKLEVPVNEKGKNKL